MLLRLPPTECFPSYLRHSMCYRVLRLVGLSHRQVQGKPAAHTHLTYHSDSPAHCLRDAPCQRQPQSGSVNLRCRDHGAAVKRLENLLQFSRIDSDPMILHADAYLLGVSFALSPESS